MSTPARYTAVEVLTGETPVDTDMLAARTAELAAMIGVAVSDDPSKGLSPVELAASARRALPVGPVAAIRTMLVPEFHVYACSVSEGIEHVPASSRLQSGWFCGSSRRLEERRPTPCGTH
jgi:hypothetical protein